jgi:hypothetical protein
VQSALSLEMPLQLVEAIHRLADRTHVAHSLRKRMLDLLANLLVFDCELVTVHRCSPPLRARQYVVCVAATKGLSDTGFPVFERQTVAVAVGADELIEPAGTPPATINVHRGAIGDAMRFGGAAHLA